MEEETLACGTGATASAIVAALMGKGVPPIEVQSRGGEKLLVDLKMKGRKVVSASLEGGVQVVFEGTYFLPDGMNL